MDVFPETESKKGFSILSPTGTFELYESFARQGKVVAFIVYVEPKYSRVYNHGYSAKWIESKKYMDNFRRTVLESKTLLFFDPTSIQFEKIYKKLLLPADRKCLKYTDSRMCFHIPEDNIYIVKNAFTFGQRKVKQGYQHVFQTTDTAIVMYELPRESWHANAKPSLITRNMYPYDQTLYNRYVFRPNSCYLIPAGTRYMILTVQKTIFKLDVVSDRYQFVNAHSFRAHRNFIQNDYNLPPPTPAWEISNRAAPEEFKVPAPPPQLPPVAPEVAPMPPVAPVLPPPVLPEIAPVLPPPVLPEIAPIPPAAPEVPVLLQFQLPEPTQQPQSLIWPSMPTFEDMLNQEINLVYQSLANGSTPQEEEWQREVADLVKTVDDPASLFGQKRKATETLDDPAFETTLSLQDGGQFALDLSCRRKRRIPLAIGTPRYAFEPIFPLNLKVKQTKREKLDKFWKRWLLK